MLNAIIELKAIKVLYKALRSTCECNQALVVDIDMIQKILYYEYLAGKAQQKH